MQRADIAYLDFDILLDRAAEGYEVRVLASPAGEARHVFAALGEVERERLNTFRAIVGGHRGGKRRIDSPEMHAAKDIGGRLFARVFTGAVGECYRSALDRIRMQPGTGLRVRLRIGSAPELADLPWEFLYDAAENQFLSLSVQTPLVRYLEIRRPVQPLAVTPPLRVLVMISNPSDIGDLDVEEEWRQLRGAVKDLEARGLVAFDRLEQATLEGLQRQLRQERYHVFHYIGHAGFDEAADDGLLILEDERGRSHPVSAERLGNILHDEETLRLAVLNACEGARSSVKDPFSGLAQSLVQKGIPAVIAMQFEISDDAAITLAHEFYRALGEGYPADAALGEARKMISNTNELEWGTPVLFLRSPDGYLFDVAEAVTSVQQRNGGWRGAGMVLGIVGVAGILGVTGLAIWRDAPVSNRGQLPPAAVPAQPPGDTPIPLPPPPAAGIARLDIRPVQIALAVGRRDTVFVQAFDAQGAPVQQSAFAWTSDNSSILRIVDREDDRAIVQAVSAGQTNLVVTVDDVRSTVPANVSAAPVPPPPPLVASVTNARVTLTAEDAARRVVARAEFTAFTNRPGAPWCVEASLTVQGQPAADTALTFTSADAHAHSLEFPVAFAALGLAEAPAAERRIGARVRVWPSGCASERGTPIGAAEALPVCVARYPLSDWREVECRD